MNNSILDLFNNLLSTSLVTNDKIVFGDFRLDSSYYINESSIKINENIKFTTLSELATVFFPGIFKRILVENSKYGIGFLTTSEMMMIEPIAQKFLSIEFTQNLDIYRVEENTLLVSRSGSVGNTIYVYDDLKKYAITEDALRVKPFNKEYVGLLYFYFTSNYGKSLITGQQSGAVIDHIYEENLLTLPIPIFDTKKNKYFYDTFLKVKHNREEANRITRKARSLVLEYNNLPPLDEAQLETLDPDKETDLRLVSTEEFTDDFRLDAHFYNPMADLAVRNIKDYAGNYKPLYEISDCSFRGGRSSRNYVDKEHGVPFLSGKNIIQIRPDLKYISKTETNNLDEKLIYRNWILITRSGTLGRTVFIWKNYEEYAASEHLIRVIPFEKEIDAAYLYAFLSSDYGYHQLLRYKHGAVIDEITEEQISKSIIPIPSEEQQKEIGDLVRQAYNLRAEAIRLEDEAQEILTKALTGN